MVIVDDEGEAPVLTIRGNIVTPRPVVREYPIVSGRDFGARVHEQIERFLNMRRA